MSVGLGFHHPEANKHLQILPFSLPGKSGLTWRCHLTLPSLVPHIKPHWVPHGSRTGDGLQGMTDEPSRREGNGEKQPQKKISEEQPLEEKANREAESAPMAVELFLLGL